jgi:hypothetical protein
MKKFFAIFAIAGVMVACNNSSDKKEGEKKDSASNMMDSAANNMNNMVDTAAKMVDSNQPVSFLSMTGFP